MQIERIISLANRNVRLRLLAMERSLRAVGCDLPIHVIPYDENRFELPANATWWEMPGILAWLKKENAHPMMAKYQCLTINNYQYVDSDVIFLRNPRDVLASHVGFITSCNHWNNPADTITEESKRLMRQRSTQWQQVVFNAGQFACDRVLYAEENLKAVCYSPGLINTCLRFRYHDQPGLNLLVHQSQVPVHNLTLPPDAMESTWAGDYPEELFDSTWTTESKKPYLIHWAGCDMNKGRAIDRLFTDFLTTAEKVEWREQVAAKAQRDASTHGSLRSRLRRLARGFRAFRSAINS